jgi:Domain of unknown function (DUF6968)
MLDRRICATIISLRHYMLIASRTLILRDGKDEIQIPIRIFAPVKAASGSWLCHYEIDWPGEHHSMDIGGVDAVQALGLVLQVIGAEIYSSSYHRSGQLFWSTPNKGYGFPVGPSLRDLLVGDDAKYF